MREQSKRKAGFAPSEKWILMSVVILGLCGVVSWFNYRTFGWADGLPYFAIVGFIALLSLILVGHIKRSPVTNNFLKAAFVYEVLLAIVLGVNSVYSLSIMREMSVAGQDDQARQESLESISKLKGSRTQREALQKMTGGPSRSEVFHANERTLFIILMGELGVALLALFTLLGLSVFDKDLSGVPDFLERKPDTSSARPPIPINSPNPREPSIAERLRARRDGGDSKGPNA